MCLSFKIIKQKRKTQFAFCYLHVDLKRDALSTHPTPPNPLHWPWPSPRLEVCACCVTLIWMLHVAHACCIGMRHSDTATTPSIKPKGDGRGCHVDFRFSTEEHNETDRGSPKFTHPPFRHFLPLAWHRNVTQYCPTFLPMRSSCHHHSHPHPLRPCRHACLGFWVCT